jgi:hypothetical protein
MSDKIIAVGFLTGRDLSLLGGGFTRHFPLPHDERDFEDLLAQLDEITIGETRLPEEE